MARLSLLQLWVTLLQRTSDSLLPKATSLHAFFAIKDIARDPTVLLTSCNELSYIILEGSQLRLGVCLLSSFFFNTKYVRCLMMFGVYFS